MTKLDAITVYPIKSLDGIDLTTVEVLPSGALQNDRRWAIVDAEQRFVNGKRTAAIHTIRANFADNLESVTFDHPMMLAATFELHTESLRLNKWLSEVFQLNCRLIEDRSTGFPDDHESPGPTLVSRGTLHTVASWFDLSIDETTRRFRANLVVDAGEPFWEDRLVGTTGQPVRYSLGDVSWLGVNPCQRCVVPSRDSIDGVATGGFQREYARCREAALPTWAPHERFDHFYRLAVNTRLAPGCRGGRLSVGDELKTDVPRHSHA
jgi:uncharacterized protein YcbX